MECNGGFLGREGVGSTDNGILAWVCGFGEGGEVFCDLMGCGSGQNGLGMGRTEYVLEVDWGILWKYLEGFLRGCKMQRDV